MPSDRPLLFATRAYTGLAADIATCADIESGALERKVFPDAERYQRIAQSVSGRDCVLVGGTDCDSGTLDLYDLACGLVAGDARSLSLVIPYFGYGTMDRPVQAGEVVTAKNRAILLSSIPRAAAGNRAFLFDAHAEGLPYYFEEPMRAFHLYGEQVLLPAIAALGGSDFVLGSVDGGRAKWVSHFADRLGVETAIVLKRRIDGARTEVVASAAPVAGRHVVVYDDMIRTGDSAIGAVRAYTAAGASAVDLVATHGVFAGEALTLLRDCGLIGHITVTDSHPRARSLECDFLEVISCAPALAAPFQALRPF
jgi:ribose-phosphate pyrophosphokinase